MRSSTIDEYVERFDRLRALRDQGGLSPAVESVLEDELTELWRELTVDECKEIERRYPELRIAV